MIDADMIYNRLLEHFPNSLITIKDLTGTRDHWQVHVVSNAFEEKTLVEQHQMIYKALGGWMHQDIHALAIQTAVP
jgi:stress-induced morphogen